MVACLLLPVMAVLLYILVRIEDWLARTVQPPRHARRRHLYLIPGGGQILGTRRKTLAGGGRRQGRHGRAA